MNKENNTYKCAVCGGIFEKGRSDEDALAEKDEIWGNVLVNECDLVCDDCFNKLDVDHMKGVNKFIEVKQCDLEKALDIIKNDLILSLAIPPKIFN